MIVKSHMCVEHNYVDFFTRTTAPSSLSGGEESRELRALEAILTLAGTIALL